MTGNLQLLLRLQELNLLHQGLTLASREHEETGFDGLEKQIARLRRRVPGFMLSHYDSLSRRYLEPMAAISKNVCQACRGEITGRLLVQLGHPNRSLCCPHCGRFLYRLECSPDYLGTR